MWAPWGAEATASPLQTGGQVPLGQAEMLADLTSMSELRLLHACLNGRVSADNLPYLGGGQ